MTPIILARRADFFESCYQGIASRYRIRIKERIWFVRSTGTCLTRLTGGKGSGLVWFWTNERRGWRNNTIEPPRMAISIEVSRFVKIVIFSWRWRHRWWIQGNDVIRWVITKSTNQRIFKFTTFFSIGKTTNDWKILNDDSAFRLDHSWRGYP